MQFLNDKSDYSLQEQVGASKVEYSYQELGIEMQKYFNSKLVWSMFWQHSEDDMRYAFEQCKRYNKPYIGYLKAVIKNRYGRNN